MFSLRHTVALLAAVPLALAQNSTIDLSLGYTRGNDMSIQTAAAEPTLSALNGTQDPTYPLTRMRCMTRMGTGRLASVPTETFTGTSIRIVNATSIFNPVVTVTPNATTSTGTITATETTTTTTVVSQPTLTISTPFSFRPFQSSAAPTATASVGLLRRDIFALKAIAARQDPTEQPGFSLNPSGDLEAISAVYPRYVHCDIRIIELRTATVVSTGAPVTVSAPAPTQTVFATTTVTVTETATVLAPRVSVYPACASNNIVNSARQSNSSFEYYFWQIQYRPFIPADRQIITTTDSAYLCCVACMQTVNCAGTFWHPKARECHISLSRAPSTTANGTTVGSPEPFCSRGSETVDLGIVNGSPFLPAESAIVVSNGPCGNFRSRRT